MPDSPTVIALVTMSEEEFDASLAAFAETAAAEDIASCPAVEPWRSEWCRYHALQEVAFSRLDLPENRKAVRDLAEKKASLVNAYTSIMSAEVRQLQSDAS